MSNPDVVLACDVVLPNIYPYWEGRGINCAVAYLNVAYQQLRSLAGSRPVIISETGWPTCGDRKGEAVPSVENAVTYLLTFTSWARANEVDYWAFSTYNELWKSRFEGPQGACWGIWDELGHLKPGMETIFSGQTVPPDTWLNCASTDPVIDIFTSPDTVTTNLRDYLVSGAVDAGDEVRINGAPLQSYETNAFGVFAARVPLQPGSNTLRRAHF